MKNNKGLTLIELIIAFALLAIVGVAATGLLGTGSRLFQSSTKELNLQTEAQSAFNHLNNFIVDSQRGINFTTEADGKLLKIYNYDNIYFIKWKSADECLYFAEATFTTPEPVPTDTDYELLVSNVKEFTANLSDVNDKNKMSISMKLAYDNREYVGTQDYALRNDIKSNVTLTELEADSPVGYNSYVESVILSSDVKYCAVGNTYAFSARVKGKGYPSQRVIWSVKKQGGGSLAPGTTIDEYGTLTIDLNETAEKIVVEAESVGKTEANTTVTASTTVSIIKLAEIFLNYEEEDALVGRVLPVTGVLQLVNSNIEDGDIVRIFFELPTEEDILAYPDKGLQIYNGVELYQTSTMADSCSLILGTDMENDAYFSQAFAQSLEDLGQAQATIRLKVTTPLDATQVFFKDVIVKPSNITGLDIGGNLIVSRGTETALSAKLEAQGVTSRDIKTTWAITDDAGLGNKVSINSDTGMLKVDKNIDYTRQFVLEVTATAKTTNSSKEVKTTVAVVIPKVTISAEGGSTTIEKGSSDRIAFMVNGLKVSAGDVICTSSPSLKNTLMYCTNDECVISVGEKESRDLVAIKLMLKENTAIQSSFTLYVLSETDMFNVEGRKNLFIEYPTPKELNYASTNKTYDGVSVRFDVVYVQEENDKGVMETVAKTIMTIGKVVYDYKDNTVKNGVTGWWIPRSNVEGKDYYIPVPGLAAGLPDEISVEYKLNYNGLLLTYTYGTDKKTYVTVLNADGTEDRFYLELTKSLTGKVTDGNWKVAK